MRVLLIDDHALVRKGIEELLRSRGVQVVASVGSGEEGVRRARELPADLVLLDVKMPGMSGIDTLRALRDAGVGAPVVMLTMSREEADLGAALRAGAQGYLLKDMEPEELLPALEAVLRGDSVVAREMVGTLAALVRDERVAPPAAPPPADRFAALTPREREVVRLTAEGHSSREIGERLFVGAKTVETYRRRAMEKLGLHSRPELVQYALRHGLLQSPE